jgi:hypothetical protein
MLAHSSLIHYLSKKQSESNAISGLSYFIFFFCIEMDNDHDIITSKTCNEIYKT